MRTLSALFLLASLSPLAQAELPKRALDVELRIQVDADGRVTAADLDTPSLGNKLTRQIEQMAMQWEFLPGVHEGRSVAVETSVYARANFHAKGHTHNAYSLELAYQGHGPGRTELGRPIYPRHAEGVNARVLLAIDLDAAGKPLKVDTLAADITPGKEQRMQAFVDSARNWVQRGHFLPEKIAGRPVPTRLQLPVLYLSTEEPSPALSPVQRAPGQEAAEFRAQSLDNAVGITFKNEDYAEQAVSLSDLQPK